MRCSSKESKLLASFALLAIGASVGLAPAEAKGGPPPKPAPRGRDTTPPVITCPSGITADAQYTTGAYVTFAVSAVDDKDPAPRVVVRPSSGSFFAIGTTIVVVTATDWKGNTATASFGVTVRPFPLPTILPPSGERSYKAYWFDADGYAYFEWDIKVSSDGTVSGTGVQTGRPTSPASRRPRRAP